LLRRRSWLTQAIAHRLPWWSTPVTARRRPDTTFIVTLIVTIIGVIGIAMIKGTVMAIATPRTGMLVDTGIRVLMHTGMVVGTWLGTDTTAARLVS
jgi:hypothetical protein